MKHIMAATVSLAALCLGTGAAFADCGVAAGSVRILSNDFEALRLINTTAGECATDAVKVTSNATAEHKNLQVPALTINPAEYTVAEPDADGPVRAFARISALPTRTPADRV